MLRYVIYGAGGIGGVVGARLQQAGFDTTLIARGEHARVMQADGLRVVSPAGQEQLRVRVALHPRELNFDSETAVLLCVKSQHTQVALNDLALVEGSAQTKIVCMQNGVANERMALRVFRSVYACVVNLPAMFINPGEVITHAQGHGGILDTGCYPSGIDDSAAQIAGDLSQAGFSARPDAAVMRQKYAKLLNNLGNILQAAVSDVEGIRGLHRQLRHEALACYAAAGIGCASAEETRERREGVYRMADIPGYERTAGSSWQSLARATGDIETDFLNGEISLLGRLHGVPTPANDVCVDVAKELLRAGQSGIYSSVQLHEKIQQQS
ncbi:MAG: 2-dehydropantoate 2-reductase N-terminal domain-containing protein [Pseudomonadota bacterium]